MRCRLTPKLTGDNAVGRDASQASKKRTIVALDANDPQPLRDDGCWLEKAAAAASDITSADELAKLAYDLFRKADKAWNERERKRRKAAAAPASATQHPKPRGPVPRDDEGTECDWDGEQGCWRASDGSMHDVDRDGKRAGFFAQKHEEAEQAKAEAEALQAQQRVDCERIDADARRRLQEEGIPLITASGPAAWSTTIPLPTVMQSMPRGYRADPKPASDLGCTCFCGVLRIERSSAYWVHVERLLTAHASLSMEQFESALPHVVAKQMAPIAVDMAAKATAWHDAIRAKPRVSFPFSADSGNCVKCGSFLCTSAGIYRVCYPCRAQPEPWCGRCAKPVKVPSIKDGHRAWSSYLATCPRHSYMLCPECSAT